MKLTYPFYRSIPTTRPAQGLSSAHQKGYVRSVCQLAEHFQCDPATLSEKQIREYFLFLRQHKRYGGSAMNLVKCALPCFFRESVKVEKWTIFEEVRMESSRRLVKHFI